MPVIRIASFGVFATLFFLITGQAIGQGPDGNHATILLLAGERAENSSGLQSKLEPTANSKNNQARLLFQTQPGSQSGQTVRMQDQVAPASYFVQDPMPQRPPLVSPGLTQEPDYFSDEQINPFDPGQSSRAAPAVQASDSPSQSPPPPPSQVESNSNSPVPLLSGYKTSPPASPGMNMPRIIDTAVTPERQPVPNPPKTWSPNPAFFKQPRFPGTTKELVESTPGLQQAATDPHTLPAPRIPVDYDFSIPGDKIPDYMIPDEWQTEVIQDCQQVCSPLFYMDLFSGFNQYDSGFGRSLIANSATTAIDFESGFDFGSRLGIYQGLNLRTDFEFSFQFCDVTTTHSQLAQGQPLQIVQAVTPGDLTTWTGLTNVYWDFPGFPTKRLKPYVGAGVGFLYATADFMTYEPTGPAPYLDSDSSLAFQIMIGGTCEVTNRLDLFAEYRYLDADAVILSTETGVIANGQVAPASFSQPTQIDLSGDSVVFGMRMKF